MDLFLKGSEGDSRSTSPTKAPSPCENPSRAVCLVVFSFRTSPEVHFLGQKQIETPIPNLGLEVPGRPLDRGASGGAARHPAAPGRGFGGGGGGGFGLGTGPGAGGAEPRTRGGGRWEAFFVSCLFLRCFWLLCSFLLLFCFSVVLVALVFCCCSAIFCGVGRGAVFLFFSPRCFMHALKGGNARGWLVVLVGSRSGVL